MTEEVKKKIEEGNHDIENPEFWKIEPQAIRVQIHQSSRHRRAVRDVCGVTVLHNHVPEVVESVRFVRGQKREDGLSAVLGVPSTTALHSDADE